MSRLADTFARLKARGNGPGLVTYVTAGDPDLPRTEGILRAHRTIVRSLWGRVSVFRKANGFIDLRIPEKIFLLKPKPKITIIVLDGGAAI